MESSDGGRSKRLKKKVVRIVEEKEKEPHGRNDRDSDYGRGRGRVTELGRNEMPVWNGEEGKTGDDPEEFLADFEQHARMHRWVEDTKVEAFQQALRSVHAKN